MHLHTGVYWNYATSSVTQVSRCCINQTHCSPQTFTGCNKTATTCLQQCWIYAGSAHSPPSQREIREAGEGNHSLYGTLCLLVSLLFLALSPCHLLVPGNTAGKRLSHLQLLFLCTLPKVQSSMSVTSLKETYTHLARL